MNTEEESRRNHVFFFPYIRDSNDLQTKPQISIFDFVGIQLLSWLQKVSTNDCLWLDDLVQIRSSSIKMEDVFTKRNVFQDG